MCGEVGTPWVASECIRVENETRDGVRPQEVRVVRNLQGKASGSQCSPGQAVCTIKAKQQVPGCRRTWDPHLAPTVSPGC